MVKCYTMRADENTEKVSKISKSKLSNKAVNKQPENGYRKAIAEEVGASTLAEPATAYSKSTVKPGYGVNNWVILHNTSKKPESKMTSFEKIHIIRQGVSKNDLEHLKEKTDLDYNQLSKVLSVARATLINKKGSSKFDSVLSERIVSVADLYSYGYEVFEDEARFNNWIFRANQALGGHAPYDLLDSQYGREEVKNLIGRIAYGVYS